MSRVETFYEKAYNWIFNFGPRFLLAVIVLFVGLWLIRISKKSIGSILSRRALDPSVRPFLQGTINIILQILLVLGLLQIMGIQMTVFAALIGAFGVAAGLALSGTLQNFASGILILLLKPYQVGDSIITQGQEGTVTSIQLFYTVVLTFDNKTVIVPNSKLSNEIIINLSREGNRRIDVELKFNYGYDFNQLNNIIEASLTSIEKVLPVPKHRVGIGTLEADGYKVVIQAWTPAHHYQETKLIFQQKLIEDLKKGGVVLPGMTPPG